MLQRIPGGLASAADIHSGDWDAVAVTAAHRRQLWDELASLREWRLTLGGLRASSPEATIARDAHHSAGYGVQGRGQGHAESVRRAVSSFDELLARPQSQPPIKVGPQAPGAVARGRRQIPDHHWWPAPRA